MFSRTADGNAIHEAQQLPQQHPKPIPFHFQFRRCMEPWHTKPALHQSIPKNPAFPRWIQCINKTLGLLLHHGEIFSQCWQQSYTVLSFLNQESFGGNNTTNNNNNNYYWINIIFLGIGWYFCLFHSWSLPVYPMSEHCSLLRSCSVVFLRRTVVFRFNPRSFAANRDTHISCWNTGSFIPLITSKPFSLSYSLQL